MDEQTAAETQPTADELNRLWQHGLHEERLFHDRLNYFSAVEIGLLSVFAILYNKDQPLGLLTPLTGAALVFTIFWLILQYKHWRYCVFLYSRLRELVPEYGKTVEGYFGKPDLRHNPTALSFTKPLSLGAPALFALTWLAFFAWIIVKQSGVR